MTPTRRIILAALLWMVACAVAAAPSWSMWEPDIEAFERMDATQPPPTDAIVFVGSSSIRLWSDLAADFPSMRVINRGFGGALLGDVAHFSERIVARYRPRAVVLYAGDNDLAAGRTPTQVADDFDVFLARVRARMPDVPVLFVSIKPSPARAMLLAQARETNARIAASAQRAKRVVFVDVFTAMLDSDGLPRRELFGDDGLHMSRAGYRLWTSILTPPLAAAIDR